MVDVALLLPKLLDAAGTNPEMTEVAAKIAWARAAGAGLRRHTLAFRLYRKTLVISVPDTIWQKQLQAMGAELVFRVNRLLRRQVVDFIEFRVDPVTLAQRSTNALRQKQESRTRSRPPISAELISAAGSITDRDLRERFLRAAKNCIARRQSRMHIE
jgi:hypothetical protein